MPTRITETGIKSLVRPSEGHKIIYDTDVKGFGVRITATGARAFVLNYRAGGRERRLTIGSYPEWTAAAARKEAEDLKRRIDRGDDPMAQRHEARAAITVAELCALYQERHLPKKRASSQKDDLSIIRAIILPRLGSTKAEALSYTQIEALHRDLSARTPYRANRVVALLHRMLSLAIRWKLLKENPAKGIERNPEQPRERHLSAAELGRLQTALASHPNQSVANAIRLLVMTGARRSEALSARWEQFDLESGHWTKPAASVKQARLHRVPLSKAALALLRRMRSLDPCGDLLFPAKTGRKPLADIKKSWAAIRERADLQDVRLHDLRHTYASHLASAGNSLPIIGALLGHSQPQTTQRYAHLLDDPLRAATDQFGERFEPGMNS